MGGREGAIIWPLTIFEYDRFRCFLGRVPKDTPGRFDIIAGLMATNQSGSWSASVYQSVHTKLRVAYPDETIDAQRRVEEDDNEYGTYGVVAIPDVCTCPDCSGALVVMPRGTRAFFYRHCGDTLEGKLFTKRCPNTACAGAANVYSHSYWQDGTGRRRMYAPSMVEYHPYKQVWHQTTNETLFESEMLRHAEMSLYYGHNGFLTQANIFNTTHERTRAHAPGASGNLSIPSTRTKHGKRRLRFAVERRALQQATFQRRALLFVFDHVPHVCSEITPGINHALDLIMDQVGNGVVLMATAPPHGCSQCRRLLPLPHHGGD